MFSWIRNKKWGLAVIVVLAAVGIFAFSYSVGNRSIMLRRGELIKERIPLSQTPPVAREPLPLPMRTIPSSEVTQEVTVTREASPTSETTETREETTELTTPPRDEASEGAIQPKETVTSPDSKESVKENEKEKGSTTTTSYRVQAGVFSTRDQADQLIEALQEKGFTAFAKPVARGYLVQCGVFQEKGRADELAQALSSAGFKTAVVSVP